MVIILSLGCALFSYASFGGISMRPYSCATGYVIELEAAQKHRSDKSMCSWFLHKNLFFLQGSF